MPLHFEANCGQADPSVRFVARGPGYAIFLMEAEALLALRHGPRDADSADPMGTLGAGVTGQGSKGRLTTVAQTGLSIQLVNPNPHPAIEGVAPQPAAIHYLGGQASDQWRHGIQTFAQVRYREVYPRTDLIYYGNQRQLEYDFVVHPGGDPARIVIEFAGARSMTIEADGGLALDAGGITVRWRKPVAYQEKAGERVEIPAAYAVAGKCAVSFRLGDFDANLPLIIDPVLACSTYLGGGALDFGEAIAVDGAGNVYVTGQAVSLNFPTTNAYRSTSAGSSDAFITKINSNGTALVYSTYLGGNGIDIGLGIAVDAAGHAYVTGSTTSTNFPTTNAFQSRLVGTDGLPDAFVVKLGPAGTNLLYSSYFGGTGREAGHGMAVDGSGQAFVGGVTDSSTDFPARNPFQPVAGGLDDAFVARFNTALTGSASLVFASFLGGVDAEQANSIVVDGSGSSYVAGEVFSANAATAKFPVTNAFQPVYGGGGSDAFVARINAAGTARLFASYLGGAHEDSAFHLALDSRTNLYLAGETFSTNFPIVNAYQTVLGRGGGFFNSDAFVAKLHPSGTQLLYSTFLGGRRNDSAAGIAVGGDDRVHVAGETKSDDFPVAGGPLQSTNGGGFSDAFVATLNLATSGVPSLVFASYLGGSNGDRATAVAAEPAGGFYVTGLATSTNDFPLTASAVQPRFGGGYSDAFVARLQPAPRLEISRAGDQTVLTWPTMPSGFLLERNTNLIATNWAIVTNAPIVSNSLNRVTMPGSSVVEFYRLRKP